MEHTFDVQVFKTDISEAIHQTVAYLEGEIMPLVSNPLMDSLNYSV